MMTPEKAAENSPDDMPILPRGKPRDRLRTPSGAKGAAHEKG